MPYKLIEFHREPRYSIKTYESEARLANVMRAEKSARHCGLPSVHVLREIFCRSCSLAAFGLASAAGHGNFIGMEIRLMLSQTRGDWPRK